MPFCFRSFGSFDSMRSIRFIAPASSFARVALAGLIGIVGLRAGFVSPAFGQDKPASAPSPAASSAPLNDATAKPLPGFHAASSARERALEARFDAALNPEDQRAWMKRLTAHAHHLGSPYNKANAEFLAAQFRAWGFETAIEEFEVLFPTPKTRVLEMTAPTHVAMRLRESPLREDGTSGQTREQLPTYNAYSIDGNVTAPVVYVNYGIPKDYETLAAKGVDVKGKIVLARYGGSWRGIKPKVAAEHGAVGCLIYSDPRDDGYFAGDVYPKGAFRNATGAQRGSVADMPLFPGDPLTPNIGAVKGAARLALKDAPTLTKIPTLPISYSDALPLLHALGGPVAPEAWRGALPLTYHIGPGPTSAHLKLAFDWRTVTARDVIAKLPGADYPDEWVIRGNHYDAWVFGAEDPISGTVALLAEAKALGALAQSGWKPRRTLVYCAWDGEEPGLLGSTEWVETHADQLKRNAVMYINSDSNGRGFLGMEGSHTLEKFFNQAARDVTDPETKGSVYARAVAAKIVGGDKDARKEARERGDIALDALGSGSDFTPFLQHLGIAALNLGFGGESEGGSYHSIFDSFDYYARFGDPGFRYGVALAQTAGRLALRAGNADTLPFEFTRLSDAVEKYVKEITKLADTMRDETEEKNRQIREGTLAASFDPAVTNVLPAPESLVPAFDFAPLQESLKRLQASAKRYDEAAASAAKTGGALEAEREKTLDGLLIATERAMTRPEGLPRRPWFTHQLYAPGFYTGYGVKTLPAIREALEQRNWTEAQTQIPRVSETLTLLAAAIDRASDVLSPAHTP